MEDQIHLPQSIDQAPRAVQEPKPQGILSLTAEGPWSYDDFVVGLWPGRPLRQRAP